MSLIYTLALALVVTILCVGGIWLQYDNDRRPINQ